MNHESVPNSGGPDNTCRDHRAAGDPSYGADAGQAANPPLTHEAAAPSQASGQDRPAADTNGHVADTISGEVNVQPASIPVATQPPIGNPPLSGISGAGHAASATSQTGTATPPGPNGAKQAIGSTDSNPAATTSLPADSGESLAAIEKLQREIDPPPAGPWSRAVAGAVAALLSTGFGMPILAALATVLMFATRTIWFLGDHRWQAVHAVVYGVVIAVICWLLLTAFCAAAGFATLQQANHNVYLTFHRQFCEAVDSLAAYAQGSKAGDPKLAQARHGLERIRASMGRSSGLQWVMGYGYIDLWRRLHAVQDLLNTFHSPQQAVADGVNNLNSLRGAAMDNADLLLTQTRQAILNIDPTAETYLDQPIPKTASAAPDQDRQAAGQQSAVPGGQGSTSDATAPGTERSAPAHIVAEAQDVIRRVNSIIVQYRDSKWAGLVGARDRLMRTTAYTGIFTLLLLAAVIIFGATPTNVEAATIFYLVGVLFGGLFQRLYSDGTSDSEVEDYGLATAQLVQISLISGLAAIAGVVLVGLLPITTSVANATASGAAGSGSGATAVIVSLPEIFSFNRLGVALPIAAVFGLTPGLLLSRLRQQATQLAGDIASSQPTNQS